MNVDTNLRNPNEIYCRRLRCRQLLGEIIEDGQCINLGAVRVWHEAVLTCSQCNKPVRFSPKNLDLISLEDLENEYGF